MRWYVIGLVAWVLAFDAAAQVPVIPGATGFGIDTPAGRGGAIIRVTNLNASGPGSLQNAIDTAGPRTIIFEVSGTIPINGDTLAIRDPYVTIAGQTAPSPGIMLRGGGIRVLAHDVLIQHLRIRVGDEGISKPNNADAVQIEASSLYPDVYNVVLDHLSISWGIDENIQIWPDLFSNPVAGISDITIRNSIISEGLYDSLHTNEGTGISEAHSMGLITNQLVRKFSMIGNLFAHNKDRNPYSRAESLVFVNNLIYNHGTKATNIGFKYPAPVVSVSIVGNHFKDGSDTPSGAAVIRLNDDDNQSTNVGHQVYIAQNYHNSEPSPADPWDLVDNRLGQNPRVNSPPIWPANLVAVSAVDNDITDLVLNNVGARPADRDSVDTRVIGEVRNGTGQAINCVGPDGSTRCQKNGGGWPTLPENHRPLTTPPDPHGDSDGNGYTNLEEWLHDMSFSVESQPVKPKSPQLLPIS